MHVCETSEGKLVDLLFAELGARDSLRLRAELEVCSPCREQHDALARTFKMMDVAAEASAPGEEFWPGYEERLRRRIMAQVIRPEDFAPDAARAFAIGRDEYRLTVLEDEGLLSRLARELRAAAERSRLTWPEFRRDPFGFTGRVVTAYAHLGWRFVAQRDRALALATSLALVLTAVFGVVALERLGGGRAGSGAGVNDELELVRMINTQDIPREQEEVDEGTAGTAKGTGGGAKPKPEKAGGGGGGGRQEELPASYGKLPPAERLPQMVAVSPTPSPVKNASLPVLPHVVGDKVILPTDTRNIPFGDPKSTSTTPSSGSGEGHGIGDGKGSGVGSGDGRGVGPGEGENTGGSSTNYGGGGPGGGGGGREVDYNRTFTLREVNRKAVITSKPEPGFTEEARRASITGTVRLKMVLGANGSVSNISVVKPLPGGLTERAIEAARRIRFTPAQKDGRSVSQWVTIEYAFNIY